MNSNIFFKLKILIIMRESIFSLTALLLLTGSAAAQPFIIKGAVTDKNSGAPLPFANVRTADGVHGAAANKEGVFELKIEAGYHAIIASYVGYVSDTIFVQVKSETESLTFRLNESSVTLPEITVVPGENPAMPIIRKAIERKRKREEILSSYNYNAYTKLVLYTPGSAELNASGSRGSISIGGGSDSLEITGIFENHSIGYFEKPDQSKDIILARKQSANFPAFANVITGGRFIQNFNDERVNILNIVLRGPLADDAPGYYYYYIDDTLSIDNKNVYKIKILPDKSYEPGFTGSIFIVEGSYDLVKVDLGINKVGTLGSFFDSLKIFQQYFAFGQDNIYMPVDYNFSGRINLIGLLRAGFELSTLLSSYKINQPVDESVFDKAVIKVLPDADEKTSSYWQEIQGIPNTDEEQKAYSKIDSIQNAPKSFWDSFSILSDRFSMTDNIYVSGPIGLYYFNRVEGHSLNFDITVSNLGKNRLFFDLRQKYGLNDKEYKFNFTSRLLLGDYRSHGLTLSVFRDVMLTFRSEEDYNKLFTTLNSLFSKYDVSEYYYSEGVSLNYIGDVFSTLSLRGGFIIHKDRSAVNTTGFAFFGNERTYRYNRPVYEADFKILSGGFRFDTRNYIEDGYFRRRISRGKSYLIFDATVNWSSTDLLKSSLDFTVYDLEMRGFLGTFENTGLNYRIKGIYTDGSLPFQMLYSLPSNAELTSRAFSFRIIRPNEYVSDRYFAAFLEHAIGNFPFRLIGMPQVSLNFNLFTNFGISKNSDRAEVLLKSSAKTLPGMYIEAGFGVSYGLLPVTLDFAFNLNNQNLPKFALGINSFIFF